MLIILIIIKMTSQLFSDTISGVRLPQTLACVSSLGVEGGRSRLGCGAEFVVFLPKKICPKKFSQKIFLLKNLQISFFLMLFLDPLNI